MKAFVLDPPRCTGCEACRVACSIENRIPMERSWRTIHHVNPEHAPGHATFHLSLACNHCARPACLEGCPAAAYSKDPRTGAVLLDAARCIGCRYCSWVCPYDAPRFDLGTGVMSKCTFCQDRLLLEQAPACAAACPTGALGVEPRPANLGEPAFPGLFPGRLGPSLRIEPAAVPMPPAMAETAEDGCWLADGPAPAAKTSFQSEWTLWLFTLGCLALVGLHLGWIWGGPRLVPTWFFLALGGLAAGLSTSHLGRPERAWRAPGNPRSSWLSREVLGFGLFLLSAALSQVLQGRGLLIGLSAGAGLLLLVSIDRLYQVAERRPFWKARSAEVLFAGIHLGCLLAASLPVVVLLAGLRSLLVLAEYRRLPAPGRNLLAAAARLAALVFPALALAAGLPVPAWSVFTVFMAGEALGRSGFYGGLEIPTPALLLGRARPTSACADPA